MNPVQAFAPGKLLLIGEYAVLDGASALVMAVDRRVHVAISSAGKRAGRLDAPQLGIRRARMAIDRGVLCCPGLPGANLGLTARMAPAILRELGLDPEEIANLDLEIDSGELFESGEGGPVKLGLGSSAAVSAALVVALETWYGLRTAASGPGRLLDRWLPVYRRALGATASGADLAAAFFGGLNAFCSTGEATRCRALEWPGGLYWRAVWVGQAAQTTDYVAAYERWKLAEPKAAKDIARRLGQVSQRAADSLGDAPALVEACAEYADHLGALGDAMGLQVMSEPHRRLAELGKNCGVVYKSCGAGGGDLGIALSTDPGRLRAFDKRVADCDGVPLNLGLSTVGALPGTPRPAGAAENQ
mgnify:CR=1 FL=1